MKFECELVISKIEVNLERESQQCICEVSFNVGNLHSVLKERLRVSVDLPPNFEELLEKIKILVQKKIGGC